MTDVSTSPAQPPRIARILVPFDFADPAMRALSYARLFADRLGASIELLHVVANPYLPAAGLALDPGVPLPLQLPEGFLEEMVKDAKQRLHAVISPAEREAGRIDEAVVVGDARREILARAASGGSDLIVMGTQGRTGASRLLLGSVAEHVVRSAPCPVLTVR
jgi:nucleotide-binding universal stress UspA family protein